MGNENRDVAPLVLKFGVPLVVSFGGIIFTLMINKRCKASQSSHDPYKHSDDCKNQVISRRKSPSSLHFDPLENHEESHQIKIPAYEVFKGYSRSAKDTHEQEIKSLRNTIKILKERESNLEMELLEYYGLKEQETAVMELQNRLKLSNMEAKIFTLKIESLQADNKRLETQMTNYKKVVADLEATRCKIKVLKKKLKSETEQHKNEILDFQQRVQKMQDDEQKWELSLDKLKGLESEVEVLRKSNHDLLLENADLACRLDSAQILATSVLEDAETEKLKEEIKNLKKHNEELSKEIEQIQADRCADVEEVVYLKWINACLRYELRNYKPGPGKTTARDLSKTLSPKSEEKAKQMILEYANKEGGREKGIINIEEIDSGRWSTSQTSVITDFGEFDESSFTTDDSSLQKSNNKFFGKLMRVLRGKDGHSSPNPPRHNHSRSSSLGRSESGGDDIISCVSPENQKLKTPLGGSKTLTHRHSDSSFYKQIDSVAQSGRSSISRSSRGGSRRSSSSGGQKSELAKYAEALNDSRSTSNFKSHKSSPSLCFF
uniref:protein CHUP1, chloroplastic n=1 Tax=Erigeron canadensis TaxID=72917 RepID=UPI001CB913D8|nr:protein CHUP1, chloroplastic [Erigeron canadensis]